MASNPRPVVLDPKVFSQCLPTAPSGSSPGPEGCTYEMLKVCLDDGETLHFLLRAAEDLARAEAPPSRHQSVHDVHHDGTAEVRRWGERNRHGHII